MDSGLQSVSESVLLFEYHVKEKIQGSRFTGPGDKIMAVGTVLSVYIRDSLDRDSRMPTVNM